MPGQCGRCGGYVGAAEEKLALGKSWHLECFTCALCNKGLDSTNLAEYKELNDIYCISCYRQFIGPQGYGYGPNGPTLIVYDVPEGYIKDPNSTKVVPQGNNDEPKNWQHPPTRLGNRFMRIGINVPHYGHASSGSKPRNFKQDQREGLVRETTSARSLGKGSYSNNGNYGSDAGSRGNRPPEMNTASSKGPPPPPPPPPPLPKSNSGSNSKSIPNTKSPAQISSRQFSFPQPPPPPQSNASPAASSNRQFTFKQPPPPPSSQSGQRPGPTPPSPPLPPAYPKPVSTAQSVGAKSKPTVTVAQSPKSTSGSGQIKGPVASTSQSNTSGWSDCPPGFYCGGKCVGTPSMPRYPPNVPETRRNPLGPNFGAVRNVPKGIGERCRRCGRPVYQAELQLGYYGAYHTECFKCCACGKKLDSTTVAENQGELFCKGCYRRNFAIHGCGFGQGAGALQTP